MLTNANDKAFPKVFVDTRDEVPGSYTSEGMTIRQYFAMHILQGYYASGTVLSASAAAAAAVTATDALITELNVGQQA